MKKTISIIILFFITKFSFGQILGQDKEGFSTIIQPSATFNLDLNENVAVLNYYRENNLRGYNDTISYDTQEKCLILNNSSLEDFKKCLKESWSQQSKKYKKLNLVYGIDLKGSSSNGLALLINEEELISSASVSGLVGLHWQKRVYRTNKLDSFAKLVFEYKDDSPKEKLLISKIEKELNKLEELGSITSSKKEELLHFKGTKSNEDKIESIEDKIESIEKRRGFIEPKKNDSVLKLRDTLLVKMQALIPIIKNNIQSYQQARSDKDPMLFDTLDLLIESVKKFNMWKNDKNLKPLNLEIKTEKYKDTTNWNKIKHSISEAKELVRYKLYKLKNAKLDGVDIENTLKAYQDYLNFLNKERKSFDDLNLAKGKSYFIRRNMFYAKGGFVGTSFKYDLANDSTAISERFKNRTVQGYRFELGYTIQTRQYNFFGFNASITRTSNAAELTSTKYKYEQTDTSIAPNLTTSNEITALSGDFDRFINYGLSFDYVRLVPFHDNNATEEEIKNSKLLLSINPYIRHNFYDRSETLKPNTSFGIGLYSFNKEKSTLGGGLFIQADDVFNINREKPINFTKQIAVGIIVKFTIKSFDPTSE